MNLTKPAMHLFRQSVYWVLGVPEPESVCPGRYLMLSLSVEAEVMWGLLTPGDAVLARCLANGKGLK